MKNLLVITWLIALLSCSRQASDTTSSVDSTATAGDLPATNPFLALEKAYDPRDEEEVNPGDSIDAEEPDDQLITASNNSDTTHNGLADFRAGAAGDPPTPEEEEAQRKIDEADAIVTSFKPLNEIYFTSTRGNEYVTYSLRFEEGQITGFCFRAKNDGFPLPIEVQGTIDERSGKFTFRELAPDAIAGTVEGEIKNGDLAGTRLNPDGSKGVPFRGKRVGPQPHELRYSFMHKVIDNVSKLFTITLAAPSTGYWQKLTLYAPVRNSKWQMLTLDWNFDGHLDLFLICNAARYCGGHFFMYQPDIRKFTQVEAIRELPNPWVDYGNKRIVSIIRQDDGSLRAANFGFDGKQFILEMK